MLERYLVDQCSPTLAGIKTGSLFSIHGEDPERVLHEVQRVNRIFYGKGLLLLPLKTTYGYSLLYLYRPCYLKRDLGDRKCSSLLKELGYTSSRPSDPARSERTVFPARDRAFPGIPAGRCARIHRKSALQKPLSILRGRVLEGLSRTGKGTSAFQEV